MIESLSISNYALIQQIDLRLAPDFNVITGETGAGKSIMLGALGLLQGGRLASKGALHADRSSRVEACFTLGARERQAVDAILGANNLPAVAGGELRICREITPSGRSKATVNGEPVTLSMLRELTEHLVDIHSQHNNSLLSDPAFQTDTLDALAGNEQLLKEYREIYARYREALKAYSDTRDEIERTRADADYLQFQFDRLDAADPQPGELERLEAERRSLAENAVNSEQLVRAAEALSWNDESALPSLDIAIAAVSSLSDDSPLKSDVLPRLEAMRIELSDVADTVAASASEARNDPRDLDEIDERISSITALMNRHGAASDTELADIRDSLARRLANLNDAPALLRSLKAEAGELKRQALEAADRISAARRKAADALEADIVANAKPLAMPNLSCRIEIEAGKLNAAGRDTVRWLFAFNKNQSPLPVSETASGGEISRIMLVLKCILAGKAGLPTIIFDEIDTGVSGDVAARMGALMADASRSMQVITITHLPQVAARGNCHFKVFKHDDETSTHTDIALLSPGERRAEIALMLSGKTGDEAALATADSLLNN